MGNPRFGRSLIDDLRHTRIDQRGALPVGRVTSGSYREDSIARLAQRDCVLVERNESSGVIATDGFEFKGYGVYVASLQTRRFQVVSTVDKLLFSIFL